ncbi:GGDEF domain-containing protein [Leptospira sarikeiensis]|uniref:diguanylate cyclase n=1 Tax=Leptospira sarikeiensis TaxID=2484943 RepID=A0A4R9K3I3_9LEPT|nr:GGDEF domain-containing protein [Leptospira sarikeiensis]TGL60619.1 GGDEF domain-containing protein [Leptospira sarikeiensis]
MSSSLKNYWIRNLNFLETLDDAILISDPKGKLLDHNSSAQELGLVPEKPDLKLTRWYLSLAEKDPKEQSHLTLVLSSVKRRFVCRTVPILLDDKEPAKAFYFRDLTEKILSEAKAQRYETLFRRRENRIKELEIRDKLTGLFNRDYTIESFQAELFRAERTESKIGIIYLDIDRLKEINEIFGTQKGDLLLKEMGKILLENSRRSDITSRIGGEEFLLLLPGANKDIVLDRAEKIRRLFSEYGQPDPLGEIKTTVSVGVAMYPEDGSTRDHLLLEAQKAMEIAKHSGKNKVVFKGINDKN